MSAQPPGTPGDPRLPPPGTLRCPRCSAAVGPDQDWCLECGAPARTRLAQTPNWQLPTVAIGAIILIAGALLAFAFVKLTDDGGQPAGTTLVPVATAPATVPPAIVPPASTEPPATTTLPASTTTAPATTPGQATGTTSTTTSGTTATTTAPATTTTQTKSTPTGTKTAP